MAIAFGTITDEWRVGVQDGPDQGQEQDLAPAQVEATFTPHVQLHRQADLEGERSWSLILRPLTYTYVDGRLSGYDGTDGVTLVSAVDDVPIYWYVKRTVTLPLEKPFTDQEFLIRPTTDGIVNLPSVTPINPEEIPAVEELYVDLAGLVTDAEAAAASAWKAVNTPGRQGLPGADGLDGQDGEAPRVGPNGNWWVGSKDLGRPAWSPDDIGDAVAQEMADSPTMQDAVSQAVDRAEAAESTAVNAAAEAVAAALVSGARRVDLIDPTPELIDNALAAMPAGSTVMNLSTGEVWAQ